MIEVLKMDQLKKLKEENEKLKNILKELGYVYIDENVQLDKDKRLQIFMNYFKGRTDVYSKKYYHKKDKKYKYSFECQNKFKRDICPISKNQKCNNECKFYKPIPLSKNTLLNHMQKKENVIGIYPLLEDNTCYLLAMDFDDDLWFDNLLSVYRAAKKHSISCIMERSQSGNGGHLWIFFEQPIKASKARALGDFLIKEAMNNNKHLSFKSFDRMFPNQDYLTGKGLGNLIALPLQYESMLHGNSLFINEFEQPIKKPFHYLLSITKVKELYIDQLLNKQENDFKTFLNNTTQLQLSDTITQPLKIIEDSMIHISKYNLNAKTLLTIRKISSTYNPKFYERLRLHLSVFNISRTLCENIEDDYEICIPRGLLEKLYEYVDQDLIVYENKTQEGNDIDISFKGALYPNQQLAADSMLEHKIAMMEAVPGFGKTVIALYIISIIQKSTLIIVHNKELLLQWKEKIDQFIEYPKSKLKRDHYIGEYHSNKKKLKQHIDVALIQSLNNLKDITVLKNYGLIIIDECHHASSETYRNVLRHLNARFIYSFSGTPERKDKMDKIIYMYLGNVVYKTDKNELIENRNYEQILIPRVTSFKVIDQDKHYTEICNELYINAKRNYLIVQDINKEVKENKNIIILTERKEHIELLYNQLKYNDYDIYTMSGEISQKNRQSIIKKLKKSEHYILIATSQLIGEGFDLPSLNTMFLTMPISFEGRISQYVGRLHRDYENKKSVKVYDYVDMNVKVLQNMFQKRLKAYKKEGYKTFENNEIVQFDHTIFTKANYEYYLHSCMNRAKKNIVIFVNDCKLYRIQKLYSFLVSLIAKSIKIYICINREYDETITSYLEGVSTKILKSNSILNAIMIDEEELWTSSSSYLGVQNNDLYYLKTNDINIIEELKDKIKR